MDSGEQLQELLQFLHDRNPQVRQIALANLLGHTAEGSPHRGIFLTGLQGGGLQQPTENESIRDLKLLCRDQLAIAHDAFRALVNLSDSPLLMGPLSEASFLGFLVSYIINPPSILADLASMLLSNITMQPAACAALIKMTVPVIPYPSSTPPYYPPQSRSATSPPPELYPTSHPQEVPALPLLVDAFVQGAKVDALQEVQTRTRKGELHFLSNVFGNVSVTPAGRMLFLTPRPVDILQSGSQEELEYPLSKLVVFTEHSDTIRRVGVASAIKNCAFHVPAHRALVSSETDLVTIPPNTSMAPGINLLPYILLPLAGPEEFDLEEQDRLLPALQFLPDTKKREPDPALRLKHAETLLLLCTTRWGRDHLRANGVYEVVKMMHIKESDDKVAEQVERLVNFLKRDEAANIEDDIEDVDGIGHVESDGNFEERVDITAMPRPESDDDDDDDNKIEEV